MTIRSAPVRSRAEALALYRQWESLVPRTVSRFLGKFPSAVSGAREREDLLSDACLVLWRCCEVYNATRGASFPTLANNTIFRRLLDTFMREKTRMINGVRTFDPVPVSLSDPIQTDSTMTLGDTLPGYERDGLGALLHAEELRETRQTWEKSKRRKRTRDAELLSEAAVVFSMAG